MAQRLSGNEGGRAHIHSKLSEHTEPGGSRKAGTSSKKQTLETGKHNHNHTRTKSYPGSRVGTRMSCRGFRCSHPSPPTCQRRTTRLPATAPASCSQRHTLTQAQGRDHITQHSLIGLPLQRCACASRQLHAVQRFGIARVHVREAGVCAHTANTKHSPLCYHVNHDEHTDFLHNDGPTHSLTLALHIPAS